MIFLLFALNLYCFLYCLGDCFRCPLKSFYPNCSFLTYCSSLRVVHSVASFGDSRVVVIDLTFYMRSFISSTVILSCRVNPKWVVYHSLVSTDRRYMRNVVKIDPSWLVEVAPHFFQFLETSKLSNSTR